VTPISRRALSYTFTLTTKKHTNPSLNVQSKDCLVSTFGFLISGDQPLAISPLAHPRLAPKHRPTQKQIIIEQGVCHTMALPFTLKSILRQKKNYGNSNISPCKNNVIFKKSSKRNQNPSRYYNFITNLKFQHKPKHPLSKILI